MCHELLAELLATTMIGDRLCNCLFQKHEVHGVFAADGLRSWTGAYIPTADSFVPLQTQAEIGPTTPIQWALPHACGNKRPATVIYWGDWSTAIEMPVQILRLLGSEDRKYVLYDDVMDEDEKEGGRCVPCVCRCVIKCLMM